MTKVKAECRYVAASMLQSQNSQDRYIRSLYEKLKAEGWNKLVYLPKDGLYNGDVEGTVDGIHPNDWGMMHLAKAYGAAISQALDAASE